MKPWTGKAYPTLIGSMPHSDPDLAIELVLGAAPRIPVWPQLSAVKAEQMMIQFLEGLPGVRHEADRIFIHSASPGFEGELLAFYEEYLQVDEGSTDIQESRFRMGPETGRTFHRFLHKLRSLNLDLAAVKGQVVGPFTLLSGLKDQGDRSILYDERLQDVAVRHLAMKCRWQIRQLKILDCPAIIFLDEPALAGYGSSTFISVSKDLVDGLLREVIEAIHGEGALAGIHVCANTDWSILFESGVDIVNFDAYSYFERFALYREHFTRFIRSGGNIAWGLVPTSDPSLIMSETPESLVTRWLECFRELESTEVSVDRILNQSLFTPSCGCGSLPEKTAERVLELTREVSAAMRGRRWESR